MQVENDLQKVKDTIHNKKSKRYWQYTIAASLILLAGLSLFSLRGNKEKDGKIIAANRDIDPGSGKAQLTLADGRIILLGEKDTTINSSMTVSAAASTITTNSPIAAQAVSFG